MKNRLKACVIVAAVLLGPGTAPASLESVSQNGFTSAESLEAGMTQTGVFFSSGNKYVSYYPGVRYGLGAFFEAGVRIGAISIDIGTKDKASLLAGADLKYQIIKQTDDIPVDLAVRIGVDNVYLSGNHVTDLSFSTVVSRGFPLTERGYKVVPYAGAELSSVSSASRYVRDEINLYGFLGAEWKISQKFMFTAEIKTGSTSVGGIGIRFEY